MKVLVGLASQTLFKDYYKLEPGHVQMLTSFVSLPWDIKIVYGLVSDNVPIFGSKRRSYLIIGGLLQMVTMLVLASDTIESVNMATLMMMLTSMSVAMNDVIVDSLMVIQSRRFPKDGSDELQSWSWCCLALGGIIGSIIAAILTENHHPSTCFAAASFTGLLIVYYALMLHPDVECDDEEESSNDESLWQDVK